MENKIILGDGIEIEYNDAILDKIRESFGKDKEEPVSNHEIAEFFKISLQKAIDKGYGVVEN